MRVLRLVGLICSLLLLASVMGACAAPRIGAPRSAPAMEPAAPAAEAPAAEMMAAAPAEAGAAPLPDVRKIIATAQVTLVVTDTRAAVDAIQATVAEMGGYVADVNLYKQTYGDADRLRGTLILRVPAERLDEVLERLAALAVDVPSYNVDRQDVTQEYTDIEARLRNLRAVEEELRAMLSEVRSRPNAQAEDILAVYRELTRIRGEIEQLQGRKNVLDNQIALATITVELIPDVATRPVVEEPWRPGVVARNALRALVSTLRFLGNAAIWFVIYILPVGVLVLAVLAVVLVVVRWLLLRLAAWLRTRR